MKLTNLDKYCLRNFNYLSRKDVSLRDLVEKSIISIDRYAPLLDGWLGDIFLMGSQISILCHEKNRSSVDELFGKVVTYGQIKQVQLHHAIKTRDSLILDPWIEIWIDRFKKDEVLSNEKPFI